MPHPTSSLIDRPLALGATRVSRNRLSLAAMTNTLSEADGNVGQDECDWLLSRATAGFGSVVTSGLASSAVGRNWVGQAGIYDDRFLPGLSQLASARAPGTVLIAQLLHCGLRSPASSIGQTPLGPSDGPGWRALTQAEVELTVEDYVTAAERAMRAGFDGVEIHAAHGYLPAQFLSRVENTRNDKWGGDFERRSAFPLELVARVRKALPDDAVVQLRLSAEDMRQSRGIDLDETVEVARRAADLGADAVSLSVWNIRLPSQKHPRSTPAAYVRARLTDRIPLIVAGSIWDAADARFAFDEGADQLGIGRMAIFNRDAPQGLRDDAWSPARPPFSVQQFGDAGVPEKFVDYLRGKWPEYLA